MTRTSAPEPSREETTRASEVRSKQWRPADQLPMPDQIPGYKFRWIRISSLGESDTRNVSSARREGWEFVQKDEMPEFAATCDQSTGTIIEFGGLALAKMPLEMWKQMKDYYQQKSDDQVDGVNNQLYSIEDKRMPIYRDHQTTVSNRGR